MPAERLAIALVTPYAWERRHEVNAAIAATGERLAARGHAISIVAPSTSGDRVRATRAAILAGDALSHPGEPPRILSVGESMPGVASAGRARAVLPIDVARTIEDLMQHATLDVCHVFEPWAPSVASAALRHSRALNVGTFHAPEERVVATQVARRLVDLVFGRLDARLASFQATADLMGRHFPAEYEVVTPGTDGAGDEQRAGAGPVQIAFVEQEERGALRLFLRALRRLPAGLDWTATVLSERGPSTAAPLREDLRARVTYVDPDDELRVLASADVLVLGSDGSAPAPKSRSAS